MTAVRIDGKALAAKVRAEVAEEVRAFGRPVCLATILVGDDPASHVYVGAKHEASHEAGIASRDHRLPAETSQEAVLSLIAELNADEDVDGILVQ
ncbi:MAG: tetrahydrofolate dehydrogenase/cyclohydrolase catalytic domain-containing protein, partial [Thermoleophilia bacterium]|nr:tetrahydrofolate dehydrogenase/cyclohydrolase catalytic domain-containing protein [Thermoleophilia bacterium]